MRGALAVRPAGAAALLAGDRARFARVEDAELDVGRGGREELPELGQRHPRGPEAKVAGLC
ncbi:MAG: hypothetical protein AAB409_06760, partial [Gemmatimonadota bacterium]